MVRDCKRSRAKSLERERRTADGDVHAEGGGGLRLHVREWGNPEGPAILLIRGWS